MGYSFSSLTHFLGGYLHEDNEESIFDVVKKYKTENNKTADLVEEINRLTSEYFSNEEIEKITRKLGGGSILPGYQIKNETNLRDWYTYLAKLLR